jgi:hypothetical protein
VNLKDWGGVEKHTVSTLKMSTLLSTLVSTRRNNPEDEDNSFTTIITTQVSNLRQAYLKPEASQVNFSVFLLVYHKAIIIPTWKVITGPINVLDIYHKLCNEK